MSAGETCGCGKASWDGVWLNEMKCSSLFEGEKKLKLAEANAVKKMLGRRHHLVFG